MKEPEEAEAKSKYKKDMIIADSIKDNLIPQVSSRENPKEMFDALSGLFERRNINRKITLRNQLKSVRAQKSKTMKSYFAGVAQIKDQLESIDDMVGEVEFLMIWLMIWPSKILGILYQRNLLKKETN